MSEWDLSPPPPSDLGDREVPREGDQLAGRRVALLVTGGIAAMKAPLIARALRRRGADVVAFLSGEGARYVTEDTLEWSTTHPVVTRLTASAEHLSDAEPFDAYLVAPATYNTINKTAHGIADSVITASLASALGRLEHARRARDSRENVRKEAGDGPVRPQILVAATMHGSLHNSVLTESLERLRSMGVRLIPPREDYGKHNIPDEGALVAEVCRAVSASPLRGRRILVTGGPTPVAIDSVRRITNRFRGTLGTLIAEELWLRGAEALLILGGGAYRPPDWLPHEIVPTYDDYLERVLAVLEEGDGSFTAGSFTAGIFSAAVADYKPKEVHAGKIPSGDGPRSLDLVPTTKVIREVRERHPDLHMVTFKYEEGVSHDELMEIALERVGEGYEAVVANRGEEMGDDHVAWLVTPEGEPCKMVGKIGIARALAEHLEAVLPSSST
jgi:phosphopantothenoylcysteine decarboxylase/phosphopantothenate--cysteine ligase